MARVFCGLFERHGPLTTFSDFGLSPAILKALAAANHVTPTPIQVQGIPEVMKGRDLLGIAQTGTGKTAAFALPILHNLIADRRPAPNNGCRVLILSPTRELASQLADSVKTYGRNLGLSISTVFGGVPYRAQLRALSKGVDVLVATPGRLIDHLDSGNIRLDTTEVFVLDEADQMLDLGFLPPIRKLVSKLPQKRQNLFFSATMPKAIAGLAGELLSDPARISVAPTASTAERVEQRAIFVDSGRKRDLLAELFGDAAMERVLIFTRTKHGADKVARHLEQAGVRSEAIHGDKNQGQRERALASFRAGRSRALVATDIAARGIDVQGVTHVVNFELPNVPESYVHRIGRTARAGESGIAISFCDGEERAYLRDIEHLIRQRIDATMADGSPVANDWRETARSAGKPKRSNGKRPGPSRNAAPRRFERAEQRPRDAGGRDGGPRNTGPRDGSSRDAGERAAAGAGGQRPRRWRA